MGSWTKISENGSYIENKKLRCDADGKKYLYDMINIKKEPSTPLG